MVYRGKPSLGCAPCRQDKKRCTLEQPACARCKRLKRPCVGYRDAGPLRVEDETCKVREKAQANRSTGVSRKPLAKGCGALVSSTQSTSIPSPQAEPGPSDERFTEVILYHEPELDMRNVSARSFLSAFEGRKHWEHLMELFHQTDPNSAISEAVQACGLAKLSAEHASSQLDRQARLMYSSALMKVNRDLQDVSSSTSEALLFAVIVLGSFEVLTSDGPDYRNSWTMHVRGACRIVELRGKAQLQTESGRSFFRELRFQHLIGALFEETDLPQFLIDWQDSLTELSNPREHGLPGDCLFLLCVACNRHMNSAHPASDPTSALLETVRLEQELEAWAVDCQSEHAQYSYDVVTVPDSPKYWKNRVHHYATKRKSMAHTLVALWQMYRCMRLLLARHKEHLYAALSMHDQISELHSFCFRTSEEICYSVPYALNRASDKQTGPPHMLMVYGQVWPLFMAAGPGLRLLEQGGVPDCADVALPSEIIAQLRWIQGRLQYIAQIMGFRWRERFEASIPWSHRTWKEQSDFITRD